MLLPIKEENWCSLNKIFRGKICDSGKHISIIVHATYVSIFQVGSETSDGQHLNPYLFALLKESFLLHKMRIFCKGGSD